MSRSFRLLPVLSLLLIGALHLRAQTPATPATAEGEIRQAIRQYDEALRKGDAATTKKFWADEYTFVNPQGERVSRADRIKNLKTGQTALSSVVHDPKKDQIRIYGDVAVYTAPAWSFFQRARKLSHFGASGSTNCRMSTRYAAGLSTERSPPPKAMIAANSGTVATRRPVSPDGSVCSA